MYELKISVKKVMGECTADPPMKPGDYFTVIDGDIQIPKGGYICVWALQSLIPLITPKERNISENPEEDWMWRVHHLQCPDPKGRVVFKIEQMRKITAGTKEADSHESVPGRKQDFAPTPGSRLKNLIVEVESVDGHCTSKMIPGDRLRLRSGRLYIPAGRHFCLYALQAAIPLLPAKQRVMQEGDWLKDDFRVLCPDPAGNVILRIEEEIDHD
jgi:uncharacterized repeat protein (TIGR04076 family)